jgi:hypothetical protein
MALVSPCFSYHACKISEKNIHLLILYKFLSIVVVPTPFIGDLNLISWLPVWVFKYDVTGLRNSEMNSVGTNVDSVLPHCIQL